MPTMIRGLSALGAALAVAGALGFSGAAYAIPRTFVSTTGNDANGCGPTTPCRSFARAMSVTDSGGEIVILDSGGYGPFTIGQSVAINAPPGVHAAITATAGTGVTINAPGATVSLNGLVISGVGALVTTGIDINAAQSVIMERCRVTGFVTGISAAVPAGTGTVFPGPTISINDSFVGFNTTTGIEISASSGTNPNGVNGVISNSEVVRNGVTGILAGDLARVVVVNSTINGHQIAVQAKSNANVSRLYVAGSAITGVGQLAVKTGPTISGTTELTLCNDSISFINPTAIVFQRDPVAACVPTFTCRIISCGSNVVFGFTSANLESPPGVVEALGAPVGGPVAK
jgi:hypothetical protein